MHPMNQDKLLDKLAGIVGAKNLLTGGDMATYLTDWRGHYSGNAQAVVKPKNTAEAAGIIKLAAENTIPIIPQGGNTSLCGGATPCKTGTGLIVATERMNKIRQFDRHSQTMTVEAGCILQNIQQAAEEEGLIFPLNFGSRGSCHIGGNLATNAGGLNVVRYGNARALCLGLEVVLPDGRIMNLLSNLKKDNTGYDLKNLFIGSEGTLGLITAATVQLFPKPQAIATAWAAVRDINASIELLHRAQKLSGGHVNACELMPASVVQNVLEFYPDVSQPLAEIPEFSILLELDGTEQKHLDGVMESLLESALDDGLITDATIASNARQHSNLWAIRELTPPSEIKAGATYKSDISVPLSAMAEFYARAAEQARAIIPDVRIFGFGHIGDGNLHYNFSIPKKGHEDFTALYPEFDRILGDMLKEYGGAISAEHGIGQKKRHMLADHKDPAALSVMAAIKAAIDPKGIMNPNKVL